MNKKNLWSLLAIMMVSVLSLGFVACSDDDDDDADKNVKGTYYVDYNLADKGNLDADEVEFLEDALDDVIGEGEWKDYTLAEVSEGVKKMIDANAPTLCAAFPGKSFTVVIYIYTENNDKEEVKKQFTVKCKNGKLA